MKYFRSPEANAFFTLAILTEKTINKLEKKLNDRAITTENYVLVRKEISEIFEKTKKMIEVKSENFVGKKSLHFPKEKKRRSS